MPTRSTLFRYLDVSEAKVSSHLAPIDGSSHQMEATIGGVLLEQVRFLEGALSMSRSSPFWKPHIACSLKNFFSFHRNTRELMPTRSTLFRYLDVSEAKVSSHLAPIDGSSHQMEATIGGVLFSGSVSQTAPFAEPLVCGTRLFAVPTPFAKVSVHADAVHDF